MASVIVAYPSAADGTTLLEAGARHARDARARLSVLHAVVVEPVEDGRQLARQTRRLESLEAFIAASLDELCAPELARDVDLVVVSRDDRGHEGQQLLARIERQRPLLVVVGRRPGRGPGQVGGALHRGASCPILSVPVS